MDNKWKLGNVHLELPELPPIFLSSSGIKPISVVLDKNVGMEIVLLITEPGHQAKGFEGVNITRFMLKTGLVDTSSGPVCFLLFYFPDPLTGAQVTYENTVNPKDEQQLAIYEQLAAQKYWHVIVADTAGEVVNFFEFVNHYGLKETLDQVKFVCEKTPATDFMAAKAEYEDTYSIEALLAM